MIEKMPSRMMQQSDLHIAKYSSVDGSYMDSSFILDFNLLWGFLGDKVVNDILNKEFKEEEKIKDLIKEYFVRTAQVESYLAGLSKSVIDSEDILSPRFQRFRENQAFVNLSMRKIIRVYTLMLQQTNLQYKEVPAQAWKRINPDQRKISREPLETISGSENDYEDEEDRG